MGAKNRHCTGLPVESISLAHMIDLCGRAIA